MPDIRCPKNRSKSLEKCHPATICKFRKKDRFCKLRTYKQRL